MAFGRPRKLFTEQELYDYAIGALARRMRSVAELKRLLRNRVEADTEIGKTLVELIVVRLKDQGYLTTPNMRRLFLRIAATTRNLAASASSTTSRPKECTATSSPKPSLPSMTK